MEKEQKTLSALHEIAEKLMGVAVLTVGDIMLDRFVYGDVHRISPESPIPVLSVKRETMMLGGAGNVLSNLRGLGLEAKLIAVSGADAEAASIRRLMLDHGCDSDMLLASEDRPTTVKTRFLASNQQLLRTDYERVTPVAEGLENKLVTLIET